MTSKTASVPNPSSTDLSPAAAKAAAAAVATSASSALSNPQQTQRRRRESSDDFLAVASLGSFAGGSGSGAGVVGDNNNNSRNSSTSTKLKTRSLDDGDSDVNGDSKPRAQSLDRSITSKGGTSSNNASSAAPSINAASSNLSPILCLSAASSPAGRRPFRKRKGSVDFTLSLMDDNDSISNLPNLLPRHSADTAAAASSTTSHNISSSLLSSTKNNRSRHNSDATDGADSTSLSRVVATLPSIEIDYLPPIETLPPIDDTALLLLHPPTSPLPAVGHLEGIHSSTGGAAATTTTHHASKQPPSSKKGRGLSFGSSKTEGRGLDHLDSLVEVEASSQNASAADRIRKESISERSNKSQQDSHDDDGSNTSNGTLNSQSHRFLLEAFMGDGTESLVLNPSQRERLGSFDAALAFGRERLGSFDAAAAAAAIGKASSTNNSKDDSRKLSASSKQPLSAGFYNRDRLSSIGGRRDRLESWGAMSDLSATGLQDQNSEPVGSGGTATAAALAATIYTSLANDVSAAADGNESLSSFMIHEEEATIPTRIAVGRDRLNSVASMATDPSALLQFAAGGSNSGGSWPSGAMALMGDQIADQLADLANSMEAITAREKDHDESEVSSTVSPLIGAASDLGTIKTGRPRSSSVSSLLNINVDLNVDYDAVAAAVDAAEAAAVAMDLTTLSGSQDDGKEIAGSSGDKNRKKRSLPLARSKHEYKQQSKKQNPSKELLDLEEIRAKARTAVASWSERDARNMEEIRAKARAAAGYVPPDGAGGRALPPKKRVKLFDVNGHVKTPHAAKPMTPHAAKPSDVLSSEYQTPVVSNKTLSSEYQTPVVSNKTSSRCGDTTPHSNCVDTPASLGKAPSQKWEAMFDALVQFIEEQKKEETKGLPEAHKKEWEWDGNVPTTYKTKDGKALGRWVNNQRSAKSKGTLKDDRENRLVAAGLKWSVLACNNWNDMLEELRIYIEAEEKAGKKWNGNVPTGYRIKVTKEKKKPFIKDDDEDKNLGRWVNRQRSLYQCGKLRKDRQLALEKIGLKWSMLATTSWDSMYETLVEYVEEKTKKGGKWDGNVQATFRTSHDPPRALGRWINRQRSAHGKKKLKAEYASKLSALGLKWSVHDRRPSHQYSATLTKPDGVGSSDTQAASKVEEGEVIAGAAAADTIPSSSGDKSISESAKGSDAADASSVDDEDVIESAKETGATASSNGAKDDSTSSKDAPIPEEVSSGTDSAAKNEAAATVNPSEATVDFSAELNLQGKVDEKIMSATI